MPRMHLEWKLSIGELFSVASSLAALAGLYYKFDARIAAIERETIIHAAELAKHDESIHALNQTIVKIDTLLDERTMRRN